MNWTATTLGEILKAEGGSIKTGPFGTTLKASEYSKVGVPVISVGEVSYGSLRLRKDTPRVSVETTSRLPDYVLRTDDIVFGRKGAVDRNALIKPDEDGWFLGSDGIRVRLPEGVVPRFIAYQLQSEVTKDWLLQHASGSTMLSLNQGTLERIPMSVPSIRDQQAIAEVLGALDDKIAANTQFMLTTDELQRTLFRSLLVEPEQIPLSATAEFINGKAFTKNATGFGRMVVRIAELNGGPGASTVYNDIDVAEQHLARTGDVLFAWSGSLTLHRWHREEAIVNQHIFKVIPQDGYPDWLVFELIRHKLDEFKAIAADKATTMGHIQRRHLDEPVSMPSRDVIASQNGIMRGLWQRGLAAAVENLRLEAIRDLLLPQLMSGKLQVKSAERLVEASA